MATKNRRAFVRWQLDVFANQRRTGTLDFRLIVVEDGDANCADLCEGNPNVTYLRYEGTQAAKVNIAIEHYPADAYAIWDDDDYHHPDRLRRQAAELRVQRADSCGLNRVHWYDIETDQWHLYIGDVPVDATTVFLHEFWRRHPCPDAKRSAWVRTFLNHPGRHVALNRQGLYIVLRHSQNQSDISYANDHFVALTPPTLPSALRTFLRQ